MRHRCSSAPRHVAISDNYGVVVVRGEDAAPVLLAPHLVAWPSTTITARQSSPRHSRRHGRPGKECASGPLLSEPRRAASVRGRGAGLDPPPNIRGAAVDRGEGGPPVLPSPNLVARPLSGGETPPALLPPDPRRVAVVWGGRRSRSAGWRMRSIFPLICSRRGDRPGEGAPPSLPPPTLVLWPLPGRAAPRSILPLTHSRRRDRPGRGCASGTPPADPRGVAVVRGGGRGCCGGWRMRRRRSSPQYLWRGGRPGGGRTSAPPPADPRGVAVVWGGGRGRSAGWSTRLQRSFPQHSRRGGRPGGGMCLWHSPRRPSSRGLCRRESTPRSILPQCIRGAAVIGGRMRRRHSSRPTLVAWPHCGMKDMAVARRGECAAGDPSPDICDARVIRGESAPLALPPPPLVPWPSSERVRRDRSSP